MDIAIKKRRTANESISRKTAGNRKRTTKLERTLSKAL
jgi:hypothetical protein